MVHKRLGISTLLWLSAVLPLSASMVSFLVIETGLRPEIRGSSYANLWEDGLMGAFFDAGYIVSNSPAARVDNIPKGAFPEEAEREFHEVTRGGADYFILVLLNYNPQGGPLKPQEAVIQIFKTGETSEISKNLIYEQRFPAGTGVNLKDEFTKVQDTARIITAQIKDR